MILAAALFIWVWLFVLNAFCTESLYQPVSALSEPELFLFISSSFCFFFYRPLGLTGAVSRITETSNHLSPGHCAQWRGEERAGGSVGTWREPADCWGFWRSRTVCLSVCKHGKR